MNKTYLIAGGASLASLAVGATGGYFFAKNKLGKQFDERLERELVATQKHLAIQLMEARAGKPESPQDVVITYTEATPEEAKELADEAKKAFTDYQGLSTTNGNAPDQVIQNNLFDTDKRPKLPPRGPGGKFLPRTAVEENRTPEPYLIEEDDFLANLPDHLQENLRWYPNDGTLLNYADEEVELAKVGEENLNKFPEVDEGEPRVIFVRNEGMAYDYEIKLMGVGLTEEMGFANGDLDSPDYVEEHDDEYMLNQD